MPKQKKLITINKAHDFMLQEMMLEDGQESFSFFIGSLIASEYKKRKQEKEKKPVGRPKKAGDNEESEEVEDEPDFTDDLPKNKPYYGRMIGARELHYLENREIEMPPNL